MGVPKFFGWLTSKVPSMIINLDDKIMDRQVHHFYIDMNGILYLIKEQFTVNEAEIDLNQFIYQVFLYVEELVYRVSPLKTLMISLDGVAPGAKLQQQRQRRWKKYVKKHQQSSQSNNSNENSENDENDHVMSDSEEQKLLFSFSPGTELMTMINQHMQYFVRRKLQDDPRWRRIQHIVLSDASVPGEGEHKIMDYIRANNNSISSTQKNDESKQIYFEDNDVHCMYGMDSDLIMLALSTHLPHFILLREHVVISTPFKNKHGHHKNKHNRKQLSKQFKMNQKVLEKRRLQILDATVLRHYIDHEFSDLSDIISSHDMGQTTLEYNLERLIDDFVFMLFLCGNDFLPNLPTLDIGEGALDYFFSIYKAILPELGGYIVDVSSIERKCSHELINVDRFVRYLNVLAQYEHSVLDKRLSKDDSFKYRLKQIKMLRERSQTPPSTLLDASPKPSTTPSTSSNTSSSSQAPAPSNFKLLFSAQNEVLKNLMTTIDTTNATTVNCKGDVKRLVMVGSLISNSVSAQSFLTDSSCSLTSDVDEQMIIKIPFKKPVTINSILLFSADSAPKNVKLFVDRVEIDFSNVDSYVPTQHLSLPEDPRSAPYQNLEHKLNPIKFDTVNHLTIYIQDNINNSMHTKLTRLGLFGQVIDMSKRTAKKKPKDLTSILSEYRKAHDHSHDHSSHGHKHHRGNTCEKECSHEHHHHHEQKEKKRPKLSPDDKYTLLPPPSDLSHFSPFNIFPYCMSLNLNNQYLTLDINEWKKRYYSIKMDIQDEEGKKQLIRKYCEGLCFVLLYYYVGLPSWSWYYPYHYAPPVSDLAQFSSQELSQPVRFKMDLPLKPLQQLLSILPPSAAVLLPQAYQALTTQEASPIKFLFSLERNHMAIDDTERTSKWESIVRIPFVDPWYIRNATDNVQLSDRELARNATGEVFLFWFDPSYTKDIYKSTLPGLLDDIHDCHTNSLLLQADQLPTHLQGNSDSLIIITLNKQNTRNERLY